MSVHVRKRARGRVAYEVVWRDAAGNQRCETFARRRHADVRDREVREPRRRGRQRSHRCWDRAAARGDGTVVGRHVEPSVTQSTAKVYATALDRYLMPRSVRRNP